MFSIIQELGSGSRHDYHSVSGGKLTDYYVTGISFVDSRGALFTTHIPDEKWIQANNRGSRLSKN